MALKIIFSELQSTPDFGLLLHKSGKSKELLGDETTISVSRK